MPTYDYKCNACGHRWELFQSMTAKHVKACPACGKKTAERLIGMGAAVMFKGGGFYQTDYRSEGYKKAAEADMKSATPESPKTETKAEPPKSDAGKKPEPAKKAEPKPKTKKAD